MPSDGWSDELVAATLEAVGLSAGADSNLPDEARFVRRVREVVSSAIERHGALSTSALYVLAPSSEDRLAGIAESHKRIHTGEIDPSGHIWFVGAAAKSAFSIPLDGRSTDGALEYCIELGFGESPCVFCDTAATPPTFAWYPSGLSEPDDVIEGPLTRTSRPTLEELLEVVDRVHRTRLMTSFNQGEDTSLWADSDHHFAHKRAEKRVQDALLLGIGGAFGPPYIVEQERPGNSGRFDIGFRESAGGGTTTLHAILELKVARSFGSTGKSVSEARTEAHIIDGVEQAYAYAYEHEARDKACLVFDLRTTDAQIPPELAEARAATLSVLLRFWRCFPNSTHWRSFILPA
jgi:hypothetical protein